MNASSSESLSRLLSPEDPEPLIVQNPGGSSPCVLVCDHAGRIIPRRLGALGLGQADLERHIAWDIGAGAVAAGLARALDAPLAMQAYSRLVIDCNRAPGRNDLVPEVSDGTIVPANQGLDPGEIRERIEAIHTPYHRGISGLLDGRLTQGRRTCVVSVHSFTPSMNGQSRPWHVGVLHQGDSPLSGALLERLRAEDGLTVGDNQPYALCETDFTVPTHAQGRGLDYIELEIRQDLIAETAGQARMAELLARLIGGLI
jgi:predicted N-formylglutamate amidohydrolase